MNQDEQHLRLLSIFHYVVAGMAFFFGCFPIFHIVFGAVIMLRPDIFANGSQPPPPAFLGAFFMGIGLTIMFFAWLMAGLIAAAGWSMARRRHHLFCLVVAAVECMLMPIGTVLGVFSIIILSRPAVQAMFADPSRA